MDILIEMSDFSRLWGLFSGSQEGNKLSALHVVSPACSHPGLRHESFSPLLHTRAAAGSITLLLGPWKESSWDGTKKRRWHLFLRVYPVLQAKKKKL